MRRARTPLFFLDTCTFLLCSTYYIYVYIYLHAREPADELTREESKFIPRDTPATIHQKLAGRTAEFYAKAIGMFFILRDARFRGCSFLLGLCTDASFVDGYRRFYGQIFAYIYTMLRQFFACELLRMVGYKELATDIYRVYREKDFVREIPFFYYC